MTDKPTDEANPQFARPACSASEIPLRACPFCGGTELTIELKLIQWKDSVGQGEREEFVVVCACGAQGKAFGHMSMTDRKVAAKYWNHRADDVKTQNKQITESAQMPDERK